MQNRQWDPDRHGPDQEKLQLCKSYLLWMPPYRRCHLSLPDVGSMFVTKVKRVCITKNTSYRADSRFAPSQWVTSLRSNAISYWLGANPESALSYYVLYVAQVRTKDRSYQSLIHRYFHQGDFWFGEVSENSLEPHLYLTSVTTANCGDCPCSKCWLHVSWCQRCLSQLVPRSAETPLVKGTVIFMWKIFVGWQHCLNVSRFQ